MQFPGTREIAQFFLGLMLLFGGMTLIPKAIIISRKNIRRGILYIVLGSGSLFLSMVAFFMAFDKM